VPALLNNSPISVWSGRKLSELDADGTYLQELSLECSCFFVNRGRVKVLELLRWKWWTHLYRPTRVRQLLESFYVRRMKMVNSDSVFCLYHRKHSPEYIVLVLRNISLANSELFCHRKTRPAARPVESCSARNVLYTPTSCFRRHAVRHAKLTSSQVHIQNGDLRPVVWLNAFSQLCLARYAVE